MLLLLFGAAVKFLLRNVRLVDNADELSVGGNVPQFCQTKLPVKAFDGKAEACPPEGTVRAVLSVRDEGGYFFLPVAAVPDGSRPLQVLVNAERQFFVQAPDPVSILPLTSSILLLSSRISPFQISFSMLCSVPFFTSDFASSVMP